VLSAPKTAARRAVRPLRNFKQKNAGSDNHGENGERNDSENLRGRKV
jgi:hypothetical protein